MKSLERLISCMVAELSDHAAMDDARFRDTIQCYDRRAEVIINNRESYPFWEALFLYSDARKVLLEERWGPGAAL
jgi:hypothetical protein